jgi:cysteine-rich repeat protein
MPSYGSCVRLYRVLRLASVVWLACGLLLASVSSLAAVSLTVELEDGDAGAGVASTLDTAARAWEQCLSQLPGSLDVAVSFRFAALPCGSGKMVAARAHTVSELATDGLLLPVALDAYREGSVLSSEHGLGIELNSALVAPDTCDGMQWSLASDEAASSSDNPELFAAVQHELGHILGLEVGYDPFSPPENAASVYLTRLVSKAHGVALSELDAEQLRTAVTTPRNVVWTGASTRALAATRLEPGVPQMYLQSAPLAGDVSGELLGSNVRLLSRGSRALAPLFGRLTVVSDACGVEENRQGQIALIRAPSCGIAAAVTNLVRDGVLAAVVEDADTTERLPVFSIPVVGASDRRLSDAVGDSEALDVILRINEARLQGADSTGNVYVHTPAVYDPAVSLVHLDPATVAIAKPIYPTSNVPELGNGVDATCGFALSMLLDLGYAKPACGDGALGPDEACDDGRFNSDVRADACRLSCQLPSCGDGVLDQGEACDDGILNSYASDACRPGCEAPHCGDGVVDIARGERCDDGDGNADDEGALCRSSCLFGRCGDGVVDDGEECDEGTNNSSESPNRCRTDCVLPRCGDGVVDSDLGETCDDGNIVGDPWCDERCRGRANDSHTGDAAAAAIESAETEAGLSSLDSLEAGIESATTSDAGLATTSESEQLVSSGCQCIIGTSSRGRSHSPVVFVAAGALCFGLRRGSRRGSRAIRRDGRRALGSARLPRSRVTCTARGA